MIQAESITPVSVNKLIHSLIITPILRTDNNPFYFPCCYLSAWGHHYVVGFSLAPPLTRHAQARLRCLTNKIKQISWWSSLIFSKIDIQDYEVTLDFDQNGFNSPHCSLACSPFSCPHPICCTMANALFDVSIVHGGTPILVSTKNKKYIKVITEGGSCQESLHTSFV